MALASPRPWPPPANGCFSGIAASADNRFVYASDPCSNRLGVYQRSPSTGDLTLLKMYTPADPGIPAPFTPGRLELSTDGRILVVATEDTLFVMRVDAASGLLSPLQTFRWPVPLQVHDRYAYANSRGRHWFAVRGHALHVLRQQADDTLAIIATQPFDDELRGLDRQSIAVSRDLRRIALIGAAGIVSYRFDPATNLLTPLPGQFAPPICMPQARAQLISLVFSPDHDVLYAGWTTREHPSQSFSNEIGVLRYGPE